MASLHRSGERTGPSVRAIKNWYSDWGDTIDACAPARREAGCPYENKNLQGGDRFGRHETVWHEVLNHQTGESPAYQTNTRAIRDVYACADAAEAGPALDRLPSRMMHSNVPETKRVARTVRENREDIPDYFGSRLTNAYLEGANSLIHSIKKAARGFRNVGYFTTVIFLWLGGLSFDALACEAG